MLLNISLKGPWNLSKPIAVRLTALVLLLSLALPMVMFSEWNTAKARTVESKPRPAAARPEPFVLPGRNGGWESLGERASMFGSEVMSIFQTQNQSAGAEDQSSANGQSGIQDLEKGSEPNEDSVKRDDTVGQFEKQLSEKVHEDATSPITEDETSEKEEAAAPPAPQPPGTVDFDFDGDGKADIGRWHPATKEFKVKKSSDGTFFTVTFSSASASAKPAPADYDGDGNLDAAVFDSGTWRIRKSTTGVIEDIVLGQSGDIPMSGDYRGDSADELVVYRPSTGYWYWREFGNATVYNLQWGGTAGDIAAPGDYDADGKMDWTVYRASTGYWYILFNNLAGYTALPWGISIDIPVQADYDGDGRTDPAIWRPTDGGWWYLKSSTSYATYGSFTWGNIGDQPVVGDFDGHSSNTADFTVFRPASGKWHTWTSQSAYQGADLGIAGDTAIPSSYVKQVGSQITPDVINKERLKARNATGGTDLFSQNFGWSRGLVSLPGRSGMDLNVGLSYNSLIWTKVDTAMLFDMDSQVGLTPGFHIGLPSIEPAHYYSDIDKWNYLMVTPSGAKVEFRQTTGAANVYETYDSSYAQITTTATHPDDPVEDITLKVVTTDGTQMSYDWISGAFRCTQIKDRNGNYISVTYDPSDRGIATITDTLGRVVNFNYTGENLASITQTWKTINGEGSNTTHTYATFSYTTKTIAHDFDDPLTVWGPYNGTALKVLDKVTYADGSFTKFHYNGYAQVFKVEEHAADSGGTAHVLNHVRVNLHTSGDGALSPNQEDVPRFTKVGNFAENFNSDAETVADITRTTGQSYTSPAGGSAITATEIKVEMDNHPHNAISKSWYGESSWKDGLPIATEDWADGTSGSERKRWTLTNYTQDNTGVTYQTNPRVTETKVGDGTNTKRTTIDYHLYDSSTIAKFGLPSEVKAYDSAQTSVIKKSTTLYNFSTDYISRRIIGLPVETNSWGWNDLTTSLEHVSKVTYDYDGDEFDEEANQVIEPVRHDNENYDEEFIVGRGNLTSVTRHDVLSESSSVTSTVRYDIAGSVVAKLDPLGRKVRLEYTDVFNDSSTPGTFAYPTKIYDPAGNFSQVKYRFDIGANVRAESPAPAGNSQGKITEREFDSIGRLSKEKIVNNGAYNRYEYPANGVQSKVFSTIIDTDSNGTGNTADEVLSESWADGSGRVLRSRTEHPGSFGGWSGTIAEYDILGRAKRQSVPTEISVANVNDPESWTPAGDDATRGWLWAHQKYDWMGRVVRKINTDGTDSPTLNDSDVLISYEGCGCAGGLVTTVEGELVPRTDPTGGNARRKQKSYADILGRTFKTESYEWDGTTVYSAVHQSFDGRDQAIRARQYAGDTSSTTFQETTSTFDGHGRLSTRHVPQQSANTHTGFTYYKDDSVHVQTDARGATTTMTYNSRGLLTGKNHEWAEGNQPIPVRKNFALEGVATASSQYGSGYPASAAINDDRTGSGWGVNGGWSDATQHSYPDWLQVDFGGNRTIDEINVITLQDDYATDEPTLGTVAMQLAITNFDVQYWNGSGWVTVRSVSNNNYALIRTVFEPVTTSKIRVVVNDARMGYSRIVELEAVGWDQITLPINTNVEYSHDAVGNRVGMTDSMGTTSYEYNELSRLTAETRQFDVGYPMPHAPLPNNSFKLQYTYGLNGQLTSLIDPFSEAVYYGHDRAGRLKEATGTPFDGVTTYASGAQYRAWGGLKQLTYGSGLQMTMGYNNGLQASSFGLAGAQQHMNKGYQYYADGKLRYVQDHLNGNFDRLNVYDHVGRIKEAKSGVEARGGVDAGVPYRQTYAFDKFDNLTSKNSLQWGRLGYGQDNFGLTFSYANGRIEDRNYPNYPLHSFGYDSDGRVTEVQDPSRTETSTYNAAGELVRTFESGYEWSDSTLRHYDGDGYQISTVGRLYVRSSILGGEVVTEVGSDGRKERTSVRAAGEIVAMQQVVGGTERLEFNYSDASGMSRRWTGKDGTPVWTISWGEGHPVEIDPTGTNVGVHPYEVYGTDAPWSPDAMFPGMDPWFDESPFYVNGTRVSCYMDGQQYGCRRGFMDLRNGAADIDYNSTHWSVLGGLGITRTPTYDYRDVSPKDPKDGPIRITTSLEKYFTGWEYRVSWNPQSASQAEMSAGEVTNNATVSTVTDEELDSALKNCIASLWDGRALLNSFSAASKGKNGSANITYRNGEGVRLTDTVHNDNTTYDQKGLRDLRNAYIKQTDVGPNVVHEEALAVAFKTATRVIDGVTVQFSALQNYTASNRDKLMSAISPSLQRAIGPWRQSQIHELGNSIAFLTGVNIGDPEGKNPGKDSDSGAQLEICVANQLGAY